MAHVSLVSREVGRTADGMELRLRSPWYRSLPLSSISIEVRVDGAAVASERMRFCVNEHDYRLDELAGLYDEFWFVLDPGRLRVRGVEPGQHEVEVRLCLRIPYLFDDETGEVLTIQSSRRQVVTVPQKAAVE